MGVYRLISIIKSIPLGFLGLVFLNMPVRLRDGKPGMLHESSKVLWATAEIQATWKLL